MTTPRKPWVNPRLICPPCHQDCDQSRTCPARLALQRAEEAVRTAVSLDRRRRVAEDEEKSGVPWSWLVVMSGVGIPLIALGFHLSIRWSS